MDTIIPLIAIALLPLILLLDIKRKIRNSEKNYLTQNFSNQKK